MVGEVVSIIVTFCVAVAILPAASVAVQVTRVSPSGKTVGASLSTEITPTISSALATPIATTFEVGF